MKTKNIGRFGLGLLVIASLVFSYSLPIHEARAVETFPDLQSFYRSTLSSSISSTATTIRVATAPNVDTAFLVLEPRTSNAEIVKMTSRSGTTLTVVRGLSTFGADTTASTTNRAHAAGTGVELVDVHYYIKLLQNAVAMTFRGATSTSNLSGVPTPSAMDMAFSTSTQRWNVYNGSSWVQMGDNSETIGGDKTFSGTTLFGSSVGVGGNFAVTGTSTLMATSTLGYSCTGSSASNTICGKTYIDNVAIAGAPDANTTTKGIVEEATSAEVIAGTSTGGTGARLFVNPSTQADFISMSMVSSSGAVQAPSGIITTVNMDANDQLFIWATSNSDYTSGAVQRHAIALDIKQTGMSTSTVDTAGQTNSGINNDSGMSLVASYLHTSTTTETVAVELRLVNMSASSGTPNSKLRMITQLIKR